MWAFDMCMYRLQSRSDDVRSEAAEVLLALLTNAPELLSANVGFVVQLMIHLRPLLSQQSDLVTHDI
jgi:hypothetical protein